MSERLRQLGGSLHIHSQSRGVRVTAIVPDDRV
jgi:signal transduction histidine kinase